MSLAHAVYVRLFKNVRAVDRARSGIAKEVGPLPFLWTGCNDRSLVVETILFSLGHVEQTRIRHASAYQRYSDDQKDKMPTPSLFLSLCNLTQRWSVLKFY